MANYAGQNIIPSEGLFRTGGTNDPGNTLYLLKGGKVYVLAPEGRAGTDDKLDAALSSLGVSRQQYDQIPVYNQNIIATGALKNQVQGNIVAPSAQDLQSAIATAKPFAQQISTPQEDPTAYKGPPIAGFSASSVGSIQGMANTPYQQASASSPAPVQQTQVNSTMQSGQKQFYRVGIDIFEVGTNRRIGSTEWNKDWTGRATEVVAPTQQSGQPMARSVSSAPDVTGQGQMAPSQGTPLSQQSIKTELTTDINILPPEVLNSPDFKKLSPDQQKLAAYSWSATQANNVVSKIRADQALTEAIKLADPLFKQQIRLVQDDVQRAITTTLATNKTQVDKLQQEISSLRSENKLKEADDLAIILDQAQRETSSREAGVGAEIARLQQHVNDIQTDLQFNKEQLSLDEQAELARNLRQYKDQLKTTQQGAVDAGLGFSSIRAEAESRLSEELKDVTESTQRRTAREIRNQQAEAQRQEREATFQQEKLRRQAQEEQIALARKTEQQIGSAAAQKAGILPSGTESLNVRGQLAERTAGVEQQAADRQALIDQLNQKAQVNTIDIARQAEAKLGTANLPSFAQEQITPLGGITGTLEQQRGLDVLQRQKELLSLQPNLS